MTGRSLTYRPCAHVGTYLPLTMLWSASMGGVIIQRHNEIRDLEAEMLRMVCTDVETEPVLQEITGEELNRGATREFIVLLYSTFDVHSNYL